MSHIARFNPVFPKDPFKVIELAEKQIRSLRNKRISPLSFLVCYAVFLSVVRAHNMKLRKLGTSQKELRALARSRGVELFDLRISQPAVAQITK